MTVFLTSCAASPPVHQETSDIHHTSTHSSIRPNFVFSKNAQIATDWPLFGNNSWQDRFSPISKINPHTTTRLIKEFDLSLPAMGSNESFPLEQHGLLYVTTGNGSVFAIHAGTGKIRWSYLYSAILPYWMPQINRGVALDNHDVFVLTPNDHLLALNKKTGQLRYAVSVANSTKGIFESMAPLYANGMIIVGSAGGDEGVRGFISAYEARSGKLAWRFYTVPDRGEGWLQRSGHHGGGAVWTTPTYDKTLNSIYVDTGNPSPDYYGVDRPGPDPYTDSVLRLNLIHGTLQFAEQEVPHDLWDYDVASPPLLFLLHGQLTVGEAGKDGYWYEWSAVTGQAVIKPVAFVRQQHSIPTARGVTEWPGSDGGANYGPSAYDPMTKDVYVAGINGPEVLYARPTHHHGFELDLGTGQNPAPAGEWTGTITAIQADSGHISWQIKTATPPIGGVTVNAGGLVWFGLQNGTLEAVSAKTGKLTWHAQTGAPIGSAPILYHWQGYNYVAVVTGGAQSLSNLFPYHGHSHVIAYRLS